MTEKLVEQSDKKNAGKSHAGDAKSKLRIGQLEKSVQNLETQKLGLEQSLATHKKELAKFKQDFMTEKNKAETLEKEVAKYQRLLGENKKGAA